MADGSLDASAPAAREPAEQTRPGAATGVPPEPPRAALPLFRAEALAARQVRWLGTPHVGQPWPVQATAAVGALAAAAIVCLLVFGGYTRRVDVQGVLASSAGTIRVAAPAAGRLEVLAAAEGAAVTRGQVLYELALDSVTGAGQTQEQIAGLLRAQRAELVAELGRQEELAAKRKDGLAVKLSDLAREIAQIDRQAAQTREFVAQLDESVRLYRSLFERRQVTSRDLLERQHLLASQRQLLESLGRDRIQREAQAHDAAAELDRADTELASRLAGLRRQVADIARSLAETEARRSVQVVASQDGVVTGIVARAGAMVRPGDPLLTLLPASGVLQARLFADSRAIGFVREGARVLMRYQAYPYQTFGQQGGTVTEISHVPLGAEEIERGVPIGDQPETRAALYRVTVRPDRDTIEAYGEEKRLQVGERLEASVFLDRRPIWQWLLDPLYAVARAGGGPG